MAAEAVAVVCHFPPPPGGMPVQAEALVAGLHSEAVEALAVPTNLGRSGLLRKLDDVRFLRSFLRGPVFIARLFRALPRMRVLHVNTCSGIYFFLFAATSVLLGRIAGKRVILHYHSGNAATFLRKAGIAARGVLRCAHQIVVPSEYLQQVFAERGFNAVIIPNICDLDRFGEPLPLRPAFVVARNLEPVYGIDTILRAFPDILSRYPHAKLTVLGSGTQAANLQRFACELGIAHAVEFTGSVKNDRIPAIFANAAVFLNASVSDNQPVSILEAFAARLPVITSDAGGIPCLVRHRETGLLFTARDHRALARAVFEMLESPGLAEHCVANAYSFVQRYSWPAVYSLLRQAYGLEASMNDSRTP